jgi:hypothetical protein
LRGYVRAVGTSGGGGQRCEQDADGDTVTVYPRRLIVLQQTRDTTTDESEVMGTWLRSVIDAILGRVPGKTCRLDTATRMATDADFSDRGEPAREARPTFFRTPERKSTLNERK